MAFHVFVQNLPDDADDDDDDDEKSHQLNLLIIFRSCKNVQGDISGPEIPNIIKNCVVSSWKANRPLTDHPYGKTTKL